MGEKDHSDQQLAGSGELSYVPLDVIRRVRDITDPIARAALVADVCRVNTLYMIMNAGSGHIGSSFSSTDIITWLWTEELTEANSGAPNADTYFSSKGHDAPALYSLLMALEKLDFDLLHRLRRLGGLPGHPDVSTPFIATNTGSLGMGVAKAYGMARAHRYRGRGGRIVVMTGDGELQEGQIRESLQRVAVQPREARPRLRRRIAADGAHARGHRRPGRRPAVGLRHRSVQGGAARALHRVRHCRAAHGLRGGRTRAAGDAAGGPFLRVL